jgi:hypothetical protein
MYAFILISLVSQKVDLLVVATLRLANSFALPGRKKTAATALIQLFGETENKEVPV